MLRFRSDCLILAVVLLSGATACGSDDSSTTVPLISDAGRMAEEPAIVVSPLGPVTLITHDSFLVSEGTLASFTAQTGIEVIHQTGGDTGQLVSSAILTAGNPLGDVMFGVDNTFLQRSLDAGLFESYKSPALSGVPSELQLDPEYRVTPIDFGDVCVNYWIDRFGDDLVAPSSLDDLIDPAYADLMVVQNPETSSPGLAFLLATIHEYGDLWEDYWGALRNNGVLVTAGWEDAYYGEFVAGGGDRSIVVSYASSPPAEVIYADPPVDTPPTGVVTGTCFRQIEFAGILAGTKHRAAAELLIDFLLTPTFQEDIPLNMFVFPALAAAELPQIFEDFVELAEDPHLLNPAEIEAHRNDWTERWTEIVLR
ncbi:MAG: thiamine ABC transporter substrate-binding protein [Acidimicrobiales bacterium]|nr:thiamine ABC transporter substrate-binding protein [Acidimicrobiales bacterium]